MSEKSGVDLSSIPIVIADVDDEKSLDEMTSKCRILMNAVGPYRFYGEQVVKSCIEQGCHYVDVTAEPQFMESMQLKYHSKAEEKGVYIVSACGFDSIPADMGTLFMETEFNGCVNSLELYMRIYVEGKTPVFSPLVNYGSWESIMYVFSHYKELREIREKLYPNGFPKFEPKLKSRLMIHKPSAVGHYSILYPGIDPTVITRSQRFLYNHEKKRPIQVKAYVAINSFVQLFAAGIVGALFIVLSQFSCGRYLLKNYHNVISLGMISKDGPSEETMKRTKFEFTFYGEGWKDKLQEPTDKYNTAMNKKIVTKVSSDYSGYEITCIAFLVSAKTVLSDTANMPGKGGVLSPAAAFSNTNLIPELQKNGLKFEVLRKTD